MLWLEDVDGEVAVCLARNPQQTINMSARAHFILASRWEVSSLFECYLRCLTSDLEIARKSSLRDRIVSVVAHLGVPVADANDK